MDVAGYEWDRNRLLGTSKQRRNLRRVYRFAAVLDGDGVVDRAASADIAARIGGGGDGVREVLFATTVSLGRGATSGQLENFEQPHFGTGGVITAQWFGNVLK